jgi:hypothetical protein
MVETWQFSSVERVTGGAFFLDKEELALAAFFLKDCEVERGVADVRVRFGVDRGVLIPRDGVLLRLPETLEGFDGTAGILPPPSSAAE